MTILSTIKYLGGLRTESVHRKSGEHITTDAPTDNNGKGAFFSPTDMVANSLGTCMITLMGIHADKNDIQLGSIAANIKKEMASNPRRIGKIVVDLSIEDLNYSAREKEILENAARTCPVAKSIHPDIKQEVTFEFK